MDNIGNVVLGNLNGSSRLGAELWSVSGGYVRNANASGVIIGQGVTKTPAGYKLYVEQGILTEKVKVAIRSTNDWSDYEFKPNYRLQSLAEVEQYINDHQHLPGIPSAAEVVEKGIDVARLDAKLLEKIEELSLYMIQQYKLIQQLKLDNQQIKRKLA